MADNVISGSVGIDLDIVQGREAFLEALAHTVWELAQELIEEYDRRTECLPSSKLN